MRFSEDKLATFKGSDQMERTIHIWSPEQPRAVILAFHGGLAHGGDFVTPALYFRGKGIATVSFDMCGHDGKRRVDIPGFEIFLSDAELILKWVKEQFPGRPIFVMGHSMGALIATHLGLGKFAKERGINGFILSSPYYVNAVKVPKLMLFFSGWLAKTFPKMKVPLEPLTDFLTHDPVITARHYADEADNIRGSEATIRFATSLLAAQTALSGNLLSAWSFPVFSVLAGSDKLANCTETQSMLKRIDAKLLEYHFYENNFHENFNELNREKIFGDILIWLEKQLSKAAA